MAKVTKGYIAYCPDLDLYHYYVAEQVDDEPPNVLINEQFTTTQLEISVAAHIEKGDEKNAQFMSNITALARLEPHVKVSLMGDDGNSAA